MIKKVIDFNRLPKQEYMKPTLKVVELQHECQILAGSADANGMNKNLQDETVETGWSRRLGNNDWEDEEEEEDL